MIKVIPNQVVCKNCMTNLEYESSDNKEIVEKYSDIVFEWNRYSLLGGAWVVKEYEEVVKKYIECPICKTK
jgi:transcription elongation factor Elf1